MTVLLELSQFHYVYRRSSNLRPSMAALSMWSYMTGGLKIKGSAEHRIHTLGSNCMALLSRWY